MTNIDVVPVGAFQDNYIWVMRGGGNAVVVDPGDAQPVLAYLRSENLQLCAILNTHHHADHVGGNAGLLHHKNVPVYGPCDERIPTVSRPLREGERFVVPEFGVEYSVFEIPGHTRTHIAFYGGGMLFCGDTLFACGCGRLFEGTPQQMHASLSRLMALPDDTRIYCGHEYTLANIRFAKAVETGNPELAKWEQQAITQRNKDVPTLPSTIGREKRANPFLRCDQPQIIAAASAHAGRALAGPVEVLAAIREWKNSF